MAAPIKITRTDLDAAGFRRAARRAGSVAAARRMLALALVMEGVSRTEAAQAAGMDRQTLRDWVHRYNVEGLAGLTDRHGDFGPKPRLSPEQEAVVARWVRRGPDLAEHGPDLAEHGVVRWRRADLARAIKTRFGVVLAERSISTVLRRLGFRRLVPRPRHPGHDAAAQASFRATSPPV
jgi:transposase